MWGSGFGNFKLRALTHRTIDESILLATLEPLVFIIVVCVNFYSPLLDYKQLEDGISVSVICDLLKE